MKQSKVYPSLVLGCICLTVALLLSVINMFTAPVIAERENALANAALSEVLPGGTDFKNITADHDLPESIIEAYSANGGFVFRVSGAGRNGAIVVMVGVDTEGKVTGTKVISESESKGYKESVYNRVEGVDGEYTGQTLETFAPVLQAGSTMTSNGFAEAIKAALQGYAIVNGGEVDLRTPEQILQDNCNAALGTTDVNFTLWFATEVLVGVEKAYESTSGFVFLIGETYVGVNETGVTTADASDEDKATALAAYALASTSASTLTEIAIPDGANKTIVKKAYVTTTGNYVFELQASGFYGGHGGTPISITISISADGKIISCRTTNCTINEDDSYSEGFGKISKEEYWDLWEGAIDSDVVVSTNASATDLGVVSGATYTTKSYQSAVKAAFKAYELLTATEGGND